MEDTVMRENIYNIALTTATYVLPSCHEQTAGSSDEAKLWAF